MARKSLTTKVVPTTVFRNNLADVLDEVEEQQKVLLISRKGQMRSAIVNLDLLEDLLEMHDRAYLKTIQKARQEVASDKVSAGDDLFGRV